MLSQRIDRLMDALMEMLYFPAWENLVATVAEEIAHRVLCGGTIWLVGNGGSQSQASHWAAELIGRLGRDRPPIPAVALGQDGAVDTCIVNDWRSGEVLFSRQAEALIRSGDVLIAISTSGKSANVVNAIGPARKRGTYVVGMTGQAGMLAPCDALFAAPSDDTATVQEIHEVLGHALCRAIEDRCRS